MIDMVCKSAVSVDTLETMVGGEHGMMKSGCKSLFQFQWRKKKKLLQFLEILKTEHEACLSQTAGCSLVARVGHLSLLQRITFSESLSL